MSASTSRARPYPVTAYAACNGLGRNREQVVASLSEGRRGLAPCPLEVPFDTVTGTIPGELPPPPPQWSAWDSRTTRVALLGLEDMHEPARRATERWGPERVALVVGTSTGGILETERVHEQWYRDGTVPQGYDYQKQHPFHAFADVVAGVVGIRGPRYVVSTACSSSGKVLASACRLMDAGVVDAAVVGGVDSLCFTTVRGFHSLGVLSAEPCRPFGVDRPGMNIGEGAAYLLVEREGDGPVRLLGVGESSDAYHMSSPDPEGKGAKLAMQRALAQGGLEPGVVDHINAHGTGTKHNDVAEAHAVESLFGDRVPVVSTKSYTGHTLGGCGGTEAVFSIVAIEQGWIPASLGADPLDPEVHIRVPAERESLRCRYVLSNSFAFGGNNCSVLLGAS